GRSQRVIKNSAVSEPGVIHLVRAAVPAVIVHPRQVDQAERIDSVEVMQVARACGLVIRSVRWIEAVNSLTEQHHSHLALDLIAAPDVVSVLQISAISVSRASVSPVKF